MSTTGLSALHSLRKFNIKPVHIHMVILIICSFGVYANTLGNGFVYDDDWQILKNSWITDFRNIPDILINDATHAHVKGVSNYYRPIMNLMYLLSYYLFSGLNPVGFHLVNILLNSFVTLLVYFTTLEICNTLEQPSYDKLLSIPLISSLIFALHPIHTEVVAWVACIPELTFSLFCLISMNLFLKSRSHFDTFHLWALFFFTLAMFCKETSITLLPILFALDYLRSRQFSRLACSIKSYLPFLLIVIFYSGVRYHALGGIAPSYRHADLTTFELLINIVPLFAQYLGKLLLPINMNAFYVFHPAHSIFDGMWISCFIAVLAFIIICCLYFKRNRLAFTGLLIIVLPLVPVFYIKGLGENTFADRYLYFPAFGFSLFISYIINYVIGLRSWTKSAYILLSLILIVYTILTCNRNMLWHDNLALYSDTVKKSPDSHIMQTNFGLALAKNNDLKSAMNHFNAAIAIDNNDKVAHVGKGVIFARNGNISMAIQEYTTALRIDPAYDEALLDIGNTYATIGDIDSAIRVFNELLRFYPNNVSGYIQLGNAQIKNNNVTAAINAFTDALRIDNKSAEAYFKIGLVLEKSGKINQAVRNYTEAVRINPQFEEALVNLGVLYAKQGNYNQAISEFDKVLAINPDNRIAAANIRLIKN